MAVTFATRWRWRAESSGPALSGGNGAAYAAAGVWKPFSTCDTVLEYFKEQAPEYLIQRAGGGGVATSREAGAPGDTEQRTANDLRVQPMRHRRRRQSTRKRTYKRQALMSLTS